MNPNNAKQQQDVDNSQHTRRIRRGHNRGRVAMPEPENVVSAVAVSAPTFRAMAVQNREPQLIIPSAPVLAKSTPHVTSTRHDDEQKLKSAETRQKPQQELVLNAEMQPPFGWNTSLIRIQNLPMYFPRDMIHWVFSPQELPDVLDRITTHLRDSSIQAAFDEAPLSAKLQTCRGNAELYLVFFNEPNGTVSMSVQRHKGDHMAANQCLRYLVDAAKGVHVYGGNDRSNPADTDTPLSANAVLAMERLIERCAAQTTAEKEQEHPFLSQTPEEMTESAVRDVGGWLELSGEKHRFDLRMQAFEYLLAMTDLKRTLSSTAVATSHIVLHGRVPSSDSSSLNTNAKNIQSTLLSVLLTRELPEDRAIFSDTVSKDSRNKNIDMDLDMQPYFPEVDADMTAASVGLPQYYIEYMNELFNLALQILVQSLEVVACFNAGHNMTNQLFAAASQVSDDKDLYDILLSCVGHAESKLANGYLACKALRLLASNHPGIKDQIKFDENAKQSIGNAYQVGGMRHKLLRDESYQLWRCVCN
jgi:hypothetical protein